MPALCDPTDVLVTVGDLQVTAADLDSALASSPFSTQINTMNEDDQAGQRGNLLRRLVAARLLALEARRLKLDETEAYRRDLEEFRMGLLYRFYMDRLRSLIEIPPATLAAMKEQFQNDSDGLAAAKASFVSQQYLALKQATVVKLKQRAKLRIHEERIKKGIKADTVLMEGKKLRVRYGDIVDVKQYPLLPNVEWIKERLYKRGELLLVANAADQEGVDVSDRLKLYNEERLPAALLEAKTAEWIPGDSVLREWYDKHPELSRVPERRHVGQLVVASRDEATKLRERILKGESLFTLAGKLSIDPVSRKQNGDIGWMEAGRGMPELDAALAALPDDQVSEVIATKVGFHLLTVLERRPGRQESFEAVRERIRQLVIDENLRPYLAGLEQRYPVSWKIMKPREQPAAAS